MKFTFPKNYSFKPKVLGFIDYSTAIVDLIFAIIIYFIINIFSITLSTKIYLFISFYFPFFLISILGISKESFFSVFIYMFKFIKNQNIYLYNKNINNSNKTLNK